MIAGLSIAMVEFMEPWALIGLLGWIPLWVWNQKSLAPLGPVRRRWSAALRSVLLLLVVLALADPRWKGVSREESFLWLVDVSRSVQGKGIETATNLVAKLDEGNGPDRQEWILFAGKSEMTDPVKLQSEELATRPLEDDQTDLPRALQYAMASFPPGTVKTIGLLSDGRSTRSGLEETLDLLKENQIRVLTTAVEPPAHPEALIRNLKAPRQARAEEPFEIEVEIESNEAMAAELSIFRNGVRTASRSMELKPGLNKITAPQLVQGQSMTEFSAMIQPEQDTFADNNEAFVYVQADGQPSILLLSDQPERARYLSLALRQEGIDLQARPGAGAPTGLGELQNFDLVILDNIPASDMTQQQMELLSSYVKDFGGGLLMLGGSQAFGLGGYFRTPIEELLPLRCDFEKRQESPSLAIVMVIDKSGSMGGEKIEMAKEAAIASAELLSPRDYIGVIAFDGAPTTITDTQLATSRISILKQIRSIQPGGGTNLGPAMQSAYDQLNSIPSKLKHAIILTDGQSQPAPFYELTRRLALSRVTVSTVGVGADADRGLLSDMAAWGGGRFYFTDNPREVPQIFARETLMASQSALEEVPFLPMLVKPADFLLGVDFDTAPFLLGYVKTQLKPTAELWLMTEQGDPLLATWRYGLGQVGGFTSDARNRWAVEWLSWEGFGPFWAQLTRRLMRSTESESLPLTLTEQEDGYLVEMDTLDVNDAFTRPDFGEALLMGPDGDSTSIQLDPVAPGRVAGFLPARKSGAYHAQLRLEESGETTHTQYTQVSRGVSEEFLPRPSDAETLKEIAESTGGWIVEQDADINDWFRKEDRTAVLEQELWPWLAGIALFLFIVDVANKRWPDVNFR